MLASGHLVEGIAPGALLFGFLSDAHSDIEEPAEDDDEDPRVGEHKVEYLLKHEESISAQAGGGV